MNFNPEIPPQDTTTEHAYTKAESPKTENAEERSRQKSPLRMRLALEMQLKTLSKKFEVKGAQGLEDEIDKIFLQDPEAKFMITASHFSDLDVAAAVTALGKIFDIQITAESLLPNKYKTILGKDHITSLDYKENDGDKTGIFNPKNFEALSNEMDKGKTPWIAAHQFSRTSEMERARIGPAYLAQKTNAYIIPAALEIKGVNMKVDEPGAIIKQLQNRMELIYHIGNPLHLEKVDISPIESALNKRQRGEKLDKDEIKAMHEAHQKLKDQSEIIAKAISSLLPEEQRGQYGDKQ